MRKGKDSLHDLTATELVEQRIHDSRVSAIWVSFESPLGKKYKAIHVFSHPKGPYILLESEDKDWDDFKYVQAIIKHEVHGRCGENISNRGKDICNSIDLPKTPTQLWVAEKCVTLYAFNFSNVKIEAVYYQLKTFQASA